MILKHHSYRPRRIFNRLCTDSRFFLRRRGEPYTAYISIASWPLILIGHYSEFECETGSSFCELHYGTLLRKLSLLSLAFTRLGGKLGQNLLVKTVPPCNSHSRPQSLLGAWARGPGGSGDTRFEVLDFRPLEMTGRPKILCPQSLLVLVLRPPGGSGDENVQFHTTRTQSHPQPRSASFCKKKKKLKSKPKIKKTNTRSISLLRSRISLKKLLLVQ